MKTAIWILAAAFLTSCQAEEAKTPPAASAPAAASTTEATKPAAAAAAAEAVKTPIPDAELDSNMPYQATRSNPVTYDVDFSAIVTPPSHAKVLRVWMPLPQSDAGQEVTDGELSTFPMKVEPKIGVEKKFGNKFAYFEFNNANGGQIIRHKFKVKVWELHWYLEPEKVYPVKTWPASFDRYLKSETQAVVIDNRFSKLMTEIVPQPGNPLNDMSSVMDWVIKDFKYDHNDASLHASSVWAMDKQEGHCSDYHGFCSAMGRVLNSPTRVTYGINPFPKNSPSHCKMEAFLPPYGWVSFDVSETQNLLGVIAKSKDLDDAGKQRLSAAAKDRLVHGFRDNTWFIQTRGTDYDLQPPAAQRAAVVRTIYAEADGQAIPDCDAAATNTRAYTWMTVQNYVPDHPVTYPFKDLTSLSAK